MGSRAGTVNSHASGEGDMGTLEMGMYCVQTKAIQMYHITPQQCYSAPQQATASTPQLLYHLQASPPTASSPVPYTSSPSPPLLPVELELPVSQTMPDVEQQSQLAPAIPISGFEATSEPEAPPTQERTSNEMNTAAQEPTKAGSSTRVIYQTLAVNPTDIFPSFTLEAKTDDTAQETKYHEKTSRASELEVEPCHDYQEIQSAIPSEQREEKNEQERKCDGYAEVALPTQETELRKESRPEEIIEITEPEVHGQSSQSEDKIIHNDTEIPEVEEVAEETSHREELKAEIEEEKEHSKDMVDEECEPKEEQGKHTSFNLRWPLELTKARIDIYHQWTGL